MDDRVDEIMKALELRAENESLIAELQGTVTTAYHDQLMQDWQMVVDKGNDKGKEIEKSLTAEIQALKWRLGYAETALGVWDKSKSSAYWEKYPETAPLPDSISGKDQ